jgi:ribosomal-protein-alanine N-acetyltransferase
MSRGAEVVGDDALAAAGLVLVPAHEADPAAVLRFESSSRDAFRRWIPDRGDGFFHLEAVTASLTDARRWWAAGTDRLHVVLAADGEVVARANLVDLAAGEAHLGYRVAADRTGRGIATAAVAALLDRAPAWGVSRVRAVTSTTNQASMRVLERCWFVPIGTRRAAFEIDGTSLDATDWLRQLAAVPVASSR